MRRRMREFANKLPIDEALPRLTAALPSATPPCWWRRPAPARPRACRWCCSTSPGRRTARSWCWSRAGSPRAPPPSAWRRRSARRSANDRLARALRLQESSRKTRIEVVTEGVFTRMILDDPVARGRRRRAVRRVPRALARRRSRPRAGARRAAGPARRSAAARHVGDARRRPRRGACSATRR